MPLVWRIILVIYSLLVLFIAGFAVSVSMGIRKSWDYLQLAFATPQNRMITGVVAVVVIILSLMVLMSMLNKKKPSESIIVDGNLSGQVSITVPAIKVIIMKAVRKVEGVKDIRPVVSNGPDGLLIYLHMMINPEHNIPEISKSIQAKVKDHIENIAGLQVAEVKILVDDFNEAARQRAGS
ncbi:MAG: alkaline shock response membrane anchor protein AmaP [Syntrophomonadaceae bacterium]|jgi:uncharacterized alkaline shock family protein YloU